MFLSNLYPLLEWLGGVVVEVDDEEYQRKVEELKFNIIDKLTLQRGDLIPTMMEIRRKLSDF